MRSKVLYVLTWTLTSVVIACLIVGLFLWFFGGRWEEESLNSLLLILIETMHVALLAATVFMLAEHCKHCGHAMFDWIYKVCLWFGSITLIVIGRDIWASGFSGFFGMLDLATDKDAWYAIVRIYNIFVALAIIAIICSFVIKLISLLCKKDCLKNKKRAVLIAGYILFIVFSIALACIDYIFDYALVIPIFMILFIVFLSMHRSFAQTMPAYDIITKEELADFVLKVKKIRFGRRYLNKEQFELLEKLSENLSDDELETMQSIIKTYSKPAK